MSIFSGVLGAAGIGTSLLGTGISANAASKAKKKMSSLADWALAGQDLQANIDESLTGMQQNFPTASALGQQFNDYYANEYQRLMQIANPNYQAQKTQYSDMISSLLGGEIPSDVASNVYRNTAGRSLFGGYSGSGLARNLTARDLGLTSLGMMQTGAGMLQNSQSVFGSPQVYDVSQLAGFTPQQVANMRANERAQYIDLKRAAIGMPGASSVWGSGLQQIGGTMAGIGGMGLMSGMGISGQGAGSNYSPGYISGAPISSTYPNY